MVCKHKYYALSGSTGVPKNISGHFHVYVSL